MTVMVHCYGRRGVVAKRVEHISTIALRAVSKNNFPKARTEMHCGKVRA